MTDEKKEGIVEAARDVGQSIIGALPPAFLLLVLLNVAFLSVVMWFINSIMEQRVSVLQSIVDSCLVHGR